MNDELPPVDEQSSVGGVRLDGEPAGAPCLPASAEALSAVTADHARPLAERLEAFDDLVESEVGDTPLLRARNLEHAFGLRQLWLKFEGDTPSGTQKDRIAFAQAQDALRRGFGRLTAASCGNYGVALAIAARSAGLGCSILVPERYRSRRVGEIEALGAEVIRIPGDYEAAVAASRRASADDDETYDANPGGDNTSLQLRAYGEIAAEIYDELRDAPAAVAIPVSNGTTLAGVHRGFAGLMRRGKISRLPRIVGGSSHNKNPIVHAVLRGSDQYADLPPERIRESEVNEPLVNWRSIDGELALAAIRSTDGWAGYTTDRRMTALARLIREKQGLSVLPAATAGLIALLDRHAGESLPSDRWVAVLTARRG